MNRRHTPRGLGRYWQTAAMLGCGLLSACGSTSESSAVDRGRELFQSKALSQSRSNDFTCATCHDLEAGASNSKRAGAALAGVTLRSTFWDGQEADLLGSINACRNYFMGDNQPLRQATSERARSMRTSPASNRGIRTRALSRS